MNVAGAAGDRERDGESPVETRTVRTGDDRTVAYCEYGAPGGTPVLFFHGSPGSRILGELFHDAARERDVRVLALDRPGYGRSDAWPDRSLADTGAFVAPVLDDAGVSTVVAVGFSGGGPHALALAATRPERVEAVDLVSGSSPPSLVGDVPRAVRVLGGLARRAPRLGSGLVRLQARLAARTSPAAVVSQYTSNGGAGDVPEAAARVVHRDFLAAVGGRGEGLVTESRLLASEWDVSLGDVAAPVRFWHGDDDANVPVAGARRLAAALPESEFTALEDTDHLNALLRYRSEVLGE